MLSAPAFDIGAQHEAQAVRAARGWESSVASARCEAQSLRGRLEQEEGQASSFRQHAVFVQSIAANIAEKVQGEQRQAAEVCRKIDEHDLVLGGLRAEVQRASALRDNVFSMRSAMLNLRATTRTSEDECARRHASMQRGEEMDRRAHQQMGAESRSLRRTVDVHREHYALEAFERALDSEREHDAEREARTEHREAESRAEPQLLQRELAAQGHEFRAELRELQSELSRHRSESAEDRQRARLQAQLTLFPWDGCRRYCPTPF